MAAATTTESHVPVGRVFLYHDGEALPIVQHCNLDVMAFLNHIVVCALGGRTRSADCCVEWNFVVSCSTETVQWTPSTAVKEEMIECGVNFMDSGSTPGFVRRKIRTLFADRLASDLTEHREDTVMVMLVPAGARKDIPVHEFEERAYSVCYPDCTNDTVVWDETVWRFHRSCPVGCDPVVVPLAEQSQFKFVHTVHEGRWIERFMLPDMSRAVTRESGGKLVVRHEFTATHQIHFQNKTCDPVSKDLLTACWERLHAMLQADRIESKTVQLPFVEDRSVFIRDTDILEQARVGRVYLYCANELHSRSIKLACPKTWARHDVRMFLETRWNSDRTAVFDVLLESAGIACIVLNKKHSRYIVNHRDLRALKDVTLESGQVVSVQKLPAGSGMRVILVYPRSGAGSAERLVGLLSEYSNKSRRLSQF